MSGLFSKPKIPKPIPPEPIPPPVMVDEARVEQTTFDRLRRKRGRVSTILSGGNAGGNTAGKAVTGA